MLVIEQTKEQNLKWQDINLAAVEGQVRRIQERIFRAAQNGEHVRSKTCKSSSFAQLAQSYWQSVK
ncbi:MAG: N-terminal domain of reverse transcriptase [Methanolobus sp.]|nr:N-terminal domain of reverse transcriptase [Methanolobus sp.]